MSRGRTFTNADIEEYRNPLIRKPTLNVQVFIDARIIAGLYRYLAGSGALNQADVKYSTVAGLSLEAFHDALARIGKLQPIESPHQAIEILRAAGFSLAQLEDKKKNRRIQLALLAEDITEGFSADPMVEQTWTSEQAASWLMENEGLTPDELLQRVSEAQQKAAIAKIPPEQREAVRAICEAAFNPSSIVEGLERLPTVCTLCGTSQYQSEDGPICKNGHLNAPGLSPEALLAKMRGETEPLSEDAE